MTQIFNKDLTEKVLECIDITKATEEGFICCASKKNDILKHFNNPMISAHRIRKKRDSCTIGFTIFDLRRKR